MNTRVKLIRKELNLSQDAFGARLGVTGAGISRIESGKRSLTEQMIILICKEFNINGNWLKSGEGTMHRHKLSTGLDQLAQLYQLDELDLKIINEYVILEDKKRKIIKDYIMRIASYNNAVSDIISDGANKNEVQICAERPDMGGMSDAL